VRARPAPVQPAVTGRRLTLAVGAAFAVLAVLPLGVIAAVPRLHDSGRLAVHPGQTLIPVSASIDLLVTVRGDTAELRWNEAQASTASGFYHVLRTNDPAGDVKCPGRVNNSSDSCSLYTDSVATTRATSFTEHPGTGSWTYRIGVAANWLDDPTLGDIYVVSKPVTVTVG